MLTGPDCSRHQGTVHWSAVRAAGHSFAIIKATEGTSYSYVGWYHGNASKVRAAGLTLGAYHFLRTGDGAAQARYFSSVVGDLTGTLAVLDVETAANGTKPTIGDVREFAGEFRRLHPGHPLVVYTGRWYWVGVMGNPHGADIGPLWHSEYEPSPDSGPDLDRYGGWPGATFWQWTSSGSCPGVSGRCDLNVFYGTHDDLAVLCGAKAGGGPAPKPPTEDDDDMIPVISVPNDQIDGHRFWAALCDGYVRIFNAWDPGPGSETNPDGLDAQTVWCPNEEYDLGVGTLYKPVKLVDARTYDVLVASAKRRPAA